MNVITIVPVQMNLCSASPPPTPPYSGLHDTEIKSGLRGIKAVYIVRIPIAHH